MARYISDFLGPLFEERSLTTEIWLGTMSNPTLDKAIADAVIASPTAMQYVKGIGLQWGMDQHAAGLTQTGLHVMQTEHKCGNYPWETATYKADKAPNDHAYAMESWGFFKNWLGAGVNSYMAWNMVLDTIGRSLDEVRPWNQNALLAVEEATGTLIATPYYYVFRHLAQYVDPGAVRVATQGGDALAFVNPDNSIVVVVHNSGGTVAPTVVSMGGRLVQVDVPARGWATINLQAQ
jgi:glucosylceramidase